MKTFSKVATLALGTLLSTMFMTTGCVTMSPAPYRTYEAQTVSLGDEDTEEATLAVRETLFMEGYDIVKDDPRSHTIEALSPVNNDMGMQTREHWTVTIEDGKVNVVMILEKKDGSAWKGHEVVDNTYSYTAEHELLNAIATNARSTRTIDRVAASE